jgi:hypothetical protein
MEAKSAHRDVWVVIILLLLIPAVLWISCNGGGKGGDPSDTGNSPKTLIWKSPTLFSDGGVLDPARDLEKYEIFINETGSFSPNEPPRGEFPAVDPASGSPVTSYGLSKIVPPLVTGRIYFVAMRVIDKNGTKSDMSYPAIQFTF